MRKILFLLIAIGVLPGIGCGESAERGNHASSTSPPIVSPPTPDPEPTYMIVKGDYTCTVVETENTCNQNGPRGELPSGFVVHVDQDTDGTPSKNVWLSGPRGIFHSESQNTNESEMHLGGTIDTAGNFTQSVPGGGGVNGAEVFYVGIFTGEGGIADHHGTQEPYFMKITYTGIFGGVEICENGEDGEATLTFDCPRM